jgi:site-specific DNA-methyltransferase (adenine-specific)
MNYEKHELNVFGLLNNEIGDYDNLKESIALGWDKSKPIELYENKIIDGWNRYSICKELDITPTFINLNFDNRLDAINHVRKQNSRRNLNKDQKAIAFGKLHLAEIEHVNEQERKKKISESMQGKPSNNSKDKKLDVDVNPSTSNFNKPDNERHKTRNEFAKATGVGRDKAQDAISILRNNPQLADDILAGKTTIEENKKKEKKEKYEAKLEEFKAEPSKKNDKYDLYHGSCLEYIPILEDASIDLLLTDPPYGMDFKSGWVDKSKIQNDKIEDTTILFESVLSSVKSKLKDDAHIYIFGNIYYMEDIKPIIEKYYKIENIIIWDRKIIGMGNLKSYGPSFDVIYFCSNLKWKDLNGVRERDILQFERVSPSNLKHPTEKPLDLLKFLIKKSSKENDTILDPFAGGGSTIIAGMELNRNVKASEIEEQYVRLIRSKIN